MGETTSYTTMYASLCSYPCHVKQAGDKGLLRNQLSRVDEDSQDAAKRRTPGDSQAELYNEGKAGRYIK